MELQIAIGQMDIVLGDAQANLGTVQDLAARAAEQGAKLLVLPELWGSGYALEQAGELADELNTGLFAAVAALARHYRLAICGSLLEWDSTEERAYNTATVYDADGSLRGWYRKIHRFGLMDEDRFLGAGAETPVFSMPWGPTALAICYDLRFPELFRRFVLDGAKLVLMPSEWPVQRIEHWRTLLRARAIENQCFVVACNRVGSDRSNTFGGRSSAIDPWGSVLGEAGDAAEVLSARIELECVDEIRATIPIWNDRRPDLYRLAADDEPAQRVGKAER
ncbi:MAG TPA: carbon-nitrogen family hydrolase [Herpetosiphonaceae bacterium]|nr:carbon-nitrogen family hydrolase [Herpetosiphonaceae bacterium]